MAVTVSQKFIKSFVDEADINALKSSALSALETVKNANGEGNDFLGWVNLPENYDKEEFARIKVAAEKIKKSCDIFVVIGIGGSYLGARAAIEFVKSPLYNNLKKDTL